MAVAAGVVADLLVATAVALVNMATQGGGAALFDGPHDLVLFKRERMLAAVAGAEAPEDVGHFQGRAWLCRSTEMGGHADGVFDQRNSAAVLRKTREPAKCKPGPAHGAHLPKKNSCGKVKGWHDCSTAKRFSPTILFCGSKRGTSELSRNNFWLKWF